MTKIQESELYMALWFKSICEKHNLRYSLDGGTLLGAVRNGRFIPWDNDMDFIMPREDLENFLKLADRELPDTIGVRDWHNDTAWFEPYPSLVLKKEPFSRFHNRPHIDIFGLDGIERNRPGFKAEMSILRLLRRTIIWSSTPASFIRAFQDNKAAEILAKLYLKLVPRKALVFMADRIIKKQHNPEVGLLEELCPFLDRVHDYYYPVKKDDFNHTEKMLFEGVEFPVLPTWENLLIYLYGPDYRIPKKGTNPQNYSQATLDFVSKTDWLEEIRTDFGIDLSSENHPLSF